MDLSQKIKHFPDASGVYLMKNKQAKIIYIGKANSLRKRVQSHFRRSRLNAVSKQGLLVSNINDIDYIETASEAEALILEANLIKEHRPRYNVLMMDDKMYPYIVVSGEKIPRISIQRPRDKKRNHKYFGPYVNPGLIREALDILRKIFRFRVCDPMPKKECLDHHIGLCDAPCTGKVERQEYIKNIKNICLILEGKKDQLYRNLKKEMEKCTKAQQFERAAKMRDQLRAIGALYSGTKDINYFKEAEQLQRVLKLSKMPERIEAFDISTIFGNQSVGSMVAFLGGKPDKKNYRKFRIKEVKGMNDVKMIAEVVKRRYSRLKNESLPFPDLILIDGGKGQLASALYELKDLDVNIPIISIAKRLEEIFIPRKRDSLKLSKDSLGLKLLQRIRDEAHRFAISYHRGLRTKETFNKDLFL